MYNENFYNSLLTCIVYNHTFAQRLWLLIQDFTFKNSPQNKSIPKELFLPLSVNINTLF